jgi:hypothetical protein
VHANGGGHIDPTVNPSVLYNVLAESGGRDFRNKAGIPQLLLKGDVPRPPRRTPMTAEHEYKEHFAAPTLPMDTYGQRQSIGRLRRPALRQDYRVGFNIGGLAGKVIKRYPAKIRFA